MKDYAWFIYLNPNDSNFTISEGVFYIPYTGNPCYVGGPYNGSPYIMESADEITDAQFYRIYGFTSNDIANGAYTNINSLIDNSENSIYNNFFNNILPKPIITYDVYKTESFNIADMHVNTYDIACNTNVFRQIFVNFSYDINDNNTITKIYADNSNGLILQTRMLNYKPNIVLPTFNTGITLFGLEIMPSSTDIGFTPIINKPQLYIKP